VGYLLSLAAIKETLLKTKLLIVSRSAPQVGCKLPLKVLCFEESLKDSQPQIGGNVFHSRKSQAEEFFESNSNSLA